MTGRRDATPRLPPAPRRAGAVEVPRHRRPWRAVTIALVLIVALSPLASWPAMARTGVPAAGASAHAPVVITVNGSTGDPTRPPRPDPTSEAPAEPTVIPTVPPVTPPPTVAPPTVAPDRPDRPEMDPTPTGTVTPPDPRPSSAGISPSMEPSPSASGQPRVTQRTSLVASPSPSASPSASARPSAGGMAVRVESVQVAPATYSTSAQVVPVTVTLRVETTATQLTPWLVSVSMRGTDPPLTGSTFTLGGAPAIASGGGGPLAGRLAVPAIVGSSLAQPVAVVSSVAGAPRGVALVTVTVNVTIPAGARPGAYRAELVVAVTRAI